MHPCVHAIRSKGNLSYFSQILKNSKKWYFTFTQKSERKKERNEETHLDIQEPPRAFTDRRAQINFVKARSLHREIDVLQERARERARAHARARASERASEIDYRN